MKKLFLSVLAAILTGGGFPVVAGTYTADFNAGTVPAGSSVIGSATVTATGSDTDGGGPKRRIRTGLNSVVGGKASSQEC